MLSTSSPGVIPISFHVLQQPHTQFTATSLIAISATQHPSSERQQQHHYTTTPYIPGTRTLSSLLRASPTTRTYFTLLPCAGDSTSALGSGSRLSFSYYCWPSSFCLLLCSSCSRVTTTSSSTILLLLLLLLPFYRDRSSRTLLHRARVLPPPPPPPLVTVRCVVPLAPSESALCDSSRSSIVFFSLLAPRTLNKQQQHLRSKAHSIIISCIRQAGSAGGGV